MNPLAKYWLKLYGNTPAELALEPYIASLGHCYRTQLPMFLWGGRYFPDFAIFALGLIVEVDGPEHEEEENKEKDLQRTKSLEAKGWRVLRCTNDEALHAPQVVMQRIRDFISVHGAKPLPLPPAKNLGTKTKKGKAKNRSAKKQKD